MKTLESTTREKIAALRSAISTVIKGKDDTIELAIVSLIAEGHLLMEVVPGVGKTTLGQASARSPDGTFHRLQFTSDLLPSDALDLAVSNPRLNEFEFS